MDEQSQLRHGQWEVTVPLENKNENHPKYPLLPGDIITKEGTSWRKHAPGLSVGGFILTDTDTSTLKPADHVRWEIA